MSALKFSSLASLSTGHLLGFGAGQQDRAKIALRALEILGSRAFHRGFLGLV
jgi:hypothetical protein